MKRRGGCLGPEKVEAKEEWMRACLLAQVDACLACICISTLISFYANMCLDLGES